MGGTDAGRISATNTIGTTGGVESFNAAALVSHTHANTLNSGSSVTVSALTHSHAEGNLATAIGAANGNPNLLAYEPGSTQPSGRGPASLSNYILTASGYYNGAFGPLAFNHYTRVYGDTSNNTTGTTISLANVANTAAGVSSTSVMQPFIIMNYIIKT
jgi:hypothetical protein